MNTEKTETRVVFRAWKGKDWVNGGKHNIIALLLDVDCNPGRCMMYEHVGQHGEGNISIVSRETRPALLSEYEDLKKELEGRGYVLKVVKKCINTFGQRH